MSIVTDQPEPAVAARPVQPEFQELLDRFTAEGNPTDADAQVSWDDVRSAINKLAKREGNWAGAPIPIDGLPLHLAKAYPYQALCYWDWLQGNTDVFRRGTPQEMINHMLGVFGRATPDSDGVVNWWYSAKNHAIVFVLRSEGKVVPLMLPEWGGKRLDMLVTTIGASQAWSLEAELTAQRKLQSLVTPVAYEYYMLTSSFMESSPRSGVTYLFRRSRPTVAMAASLDGDDMKILATLCMHPIGWYHGSFAGCMAPTDEVIAHLLMSRADEHLYWRKSNQHPLWSACSGL